MGAGSIQRSVVIADSAKNVQVNAKGTQPKFVIQLRQLPCSESAGSGRSINQRRVDTPNAEFLTGWFEERYRDSANPAAALPTICL